jgi:DNA-binding XRE family transcriptional regulator
MAEATTQINVTPKQLGKHLRSIRRKKGLSLSEVARGAGLSRRELVAYERGKVAIPESDLWVLAGSCGVDVSELVPSTPSLELTEAATSTSVGDTVSQLRKGQEDAGLAQYLPTLQKLQALAPGKRIPVKERELEEIATALGATPRSIELKLRELLDCTPE